MTFTVTNRIEELHIDMLYELLTSLVFSFSHEDFRISKVYTNEKIWLTDFKYALVLEPTNKRAASSAERLRKLFQ